MDSSEERDDSLDDGFLTKVVLNVKKRSIERTAIEGMSYSEL